jgi:hypothetical protein
MLTQEYVDKLTQLLGMEGWTQILSPAIERLRDNSVRLLLMPGVQKEIRNKQGVPSAMFTDDYLKGKIDTLNWLLTWNQRTANLAQELAEMDEAINSPAPEALGTPYAPQAGEANPPEEQ